MRLCSILANGAAMGSSGIELAMEVGAPRIAAEALSRHLHVADTAAAACCMIGNVNGAADSREVAEKFLASGAIEAVYAAAEVHEGAMPVARRVCAALGNVSFLTEGPAFHRRIAAVLMRLSRLYPDDPELVQAACSGLMALKEHGDMDRYLIEQGALPLLTHIIRANDGNPELAVRAAGCIVLLLSRWSEDDDAPAESKPAPPFTANHLVETGTAEVLIALLRRCVSVGAADLSFVVTALEVILGHLDAAHVKHLAVRASIALVGALRLQIKLRVRFHDAQGIFQCLQMLTLHATAADCLDRLGLVDTILAALKHYHNKVVCLHLACRVLRNLAAEAPTRAQIMRSGVLDQLCKMTDALLSFEACDTAAAFCTVIRNLAIAPENRLELLRGAREGSVLPAITLVALRTVMLAEIGETAEPDEPSLWDAWSCVAALAMEPGNCAALVKTRLVHTATIQLVDESCSARVAWATSVVLLRTTAAAVAAAAHDDSALFLTLAKDNPVGAALGLTLLRRCHDSRVVAAAAGALRPFLAHMRRLCPGAPAGTFHDISSGLTAARDAQAALKTDAAERALKFVREAAGVVAAWI